MANEYVLIDFLVIGAQKAGSTYVLNCLEEHPEIFMPPYEFGFFEDPVFEHKTASELAMHFQGVAEDQVVGAKRPNLLGHHECPPRLKEIYPELKLVVILRNPVERDISG